MATILEPGRQAPDPDAPAKRILRSEAGGGGQFPRRAHRQPEAHAALLKISSRYALAGALSRANASMIPARRSG